MAIGDIYRLTLEQSYAGTVNMASAYYLREVVTNTSDPMDALAAIGNGTFLAIYAGVQWDGVVYRGVRVQRLSGDNVLSSRFYAPGIATGSRSGNPLPANAAAVVKKRTAGTGRVRKGRNYVSGLLVGDQQDGTWTTAAIDLLFILALLNSSNWSASGFTFRTGLYGPKERIFRNDTAFPGKTAVNPIVRQWRTRGSKR